MKPLITTKNLCLYYGTAEVLHDVTFRVEKGDVIALVGPNGAGKSSLVKAILGLVPLKSGIVELFGKDGKYFDEWSRVGYLPQRSNTFNPLFPATVREVVGLGLLSQKKFPKKFSKNDGEKISAALDLMGIAGLMDRLVGDLSGGQQQRVFLARAIVHNPELLILDEPSTALDPEARGNFFATIKRLNASLGITIILITHDTAQIGQYANKLLYLDKTVVFYGGFDEFCASPDMERYFGDEGQHLICRQHHGEHT